MKISKPRPYRMNARAKSAEDTARRILDAAKLRFEQVDYAEVTLAVIGRDAGVSEQTVIRRFRNKEHLFAAVIEREFPRVEEERWPPSGPGCSLEEAVRVLVDHYEKDGRAILNYLAQEHRSSTIQALLDGGRKMHEQWVRSFCASALGNTDSDAGRKRVEAAVAATDLYVWKLLRLDRALPRQEVEQIILVLLRGLVDNEEK